MTFVQALRRKFCSF